MNTIYLTIVPSLSHVTLHFVQQLHEAIQSKTVKLVHVGSHFEHCLTRNYRVLYEHFQE